MIETELKSKEVINDEKEQQKRIFFVSHYIYIYKNWDFFNHAYTRDDDVWELVDFLKQ